ncbi:MAG: preprotein translocase subunit YajC [Acidimicrobiales bacterium]
MQLIILVVFAALMYALLIVPQQKRMKAQRALLESLHEGDHVLTTSGMYGNIIEFEESIVWLEIAKGVEIKVARDSVQAVIGDETGATDAELTVDDDGDDDSEDHNDSEAPDDSEELEDEA